MGVYYNFIQIFGKNPLLWLLPVFMKSGKPVGDGVVWPQKPSSQKYEIDMNVRNVVIQQHFSILKLIFREETHPNKVLQSSIELPCMEKVMPIQPPLVTSQLL
jgi:hypothetical protein